MGDDLDGAAQVGALPLPVQYRPVDLSGGHGGIHRQILVGEAFIVAQVQVGLRSVVGDENLAVLVGAHGAGVYVEIGVELLEGHLQSPGLQQPPQGRRRDALAQAGDHAPGDKDILCHCVSSHAAWDAIAPGRPCPRLLLTKNLFHFTAPGRARQGLSARKRLLSCNFFRKIETLL